MYDLDLFQLNYELETITRSNSSETEKATEHSAIREKYNNKIIANRDHLVDLIRLAAARDGLQDLRKDLDLEITDPQHDVEKQRQVDLFTAFCNNCLVFMVKKRDWKHYRNSDMITKFITVPDEAMGMLALENIAPDLLEIIDRHETSGDTPSGKKKSSKAIYTSRKAGATFGTIRGWHSSGITRYNRLCTMLLQLRTNVTSKELETHLQKTYNDADGITNYGEDGETTSTFSDDSEAEMPFDLFSAAATV